MPNEHHSSDANGVFKHTAGLVTAASGFYMKKWQLPLWKKLSPTLSLEQSCWLSRALDARKPLNAWAAH